MWKCPKGFNCSIRQKKLQLWFSNESKLPACMYSTTVRETVHVVRWVWFFFRCNTLHTCAYNGVYPQFQNNINVPLPDIQTYLQLFFECSLTLYRYFGDKFSMQTITGMWGLIGMWEENHKVDQLKKRQKTPKKLYSCDLSLHTKL